jgi:hypothetical protein
MYLFFLAGVSDHFTGTVLVRCLAALFCCDSIGPCTVIKRILILTTFFFLIGASDTGVGLVFVLISSILFLVEWWKRLHSDELMLSHTLFAAVATDDRRRRCNANGVRISCEARKSSPYPRIRSTRKKCPTDFSPKMKIIGDYKTLSIGADSYHRYCTNTHFVGSLGLGTCARKLHPFSKTHKGLLMVERSKVKKFLRNTPHKLNWEQLIYFTKGYTRGTYLFTLDHKHDTSLSGGNDTGSPSASVAAPTTTGSPVASVLQYMNLTKSKWASGSPSASLSSLSTCLRPLIRPKKKRKLRSPLGNMGRWMLLQVNILPLCK